MHWSLPFDHRAALYLELDEQHWGRTRFFGAAALTNTVLGRFYRMLPLRTRPVSYNFLARLGAGLQEANLQFAQQLDSRNVSGPELDFHMVRGEQRLVQNAISAHEAHAPAQWPLVRRELNDMLNQDRVTSLIGRTFTCSRRYTGVLCKIRREAAARLDFSRESDRVRIGMELIQHVRQCKQSVGAQR